MATVQGYVNTPRLQQVAQVTKTTAGYAGAAARAALVGQLWPRGNQKGH